MQDRAKLSGLIQSQDNDRQRATEAGTQHSRSVPEQSSGLCKEGLSQQQNEGRGEPRRVVLEWDGLGQLWLRDLAEIKRAGPQICQEFC